MVVTLLLVHIRLVPQTGNKSLGTTTLHFLARISTDGERQDVIQVISISYYLVIKFLKLGCTVLKFAYIPH